jgi:uncharacterized membrane protein
VNRDAATRDPLIRRMMLIASGIWLAFAALLLGAGVQVFTDLQLFGFIDVAARLLIGWIHVLGIFAASIVCFSVSMILFSYSSPNVTAAPAGEGHLD